MLTKVKPWVRTSDDRLTRESQPGCHGALCSRCDDHTHTMSFSQLTGLYWIVVLCFSPCSVTINLFCVTSPAYRCRLWDIKDGLFFLFEITLLACNAADQHNAPNIRTFSLWTERIRLVDVNRTAGTLYFFTFFSILAKKMSLLNALIASCKSIY